MHKAMYNVMHNVAPQGTTPPSGAKLFYFKKIQGDCQALKKLFH